MLRTLGIVAVIAAAAAAETLFTPSITGVSLQPAIQGPASIILIDDLHLDFTSTGRIKELYRTIVQQLLQEQDLAGVVSTGPSSIAIDVTRDRNRLESAAADISGAGLKPAEILSDLSTQQNSEVRYRAHVAFGTAYGVLEGFARVAAPHKALIYISNGYSMDLRAGAPSSSNVNPFEAEGNNITEQRLRDEVAELTQQAKRANVTVYAINAAALFGSPTIDPKVEKVAWEGFQANAQRSLELLSEPSGGFVIRDDLEGGLKRVFGSIHR